jgi:hypothetical protein
MIGIDSLGKFVPIVVNRNARLAGERGTYLPFDIHMGYKAGTHKRQIELELHPL